MTPEERATEAAQLIDATVVRNQAHYVEIWNRVVAQAIREAENEAIERAANAVSPWMQRLSRQESVDAAAAIRALYHQS